MISNDKLYLINLSHQQKYSVCQLIKEKKNQKIGGHTQGQPLKNPKSNGDQTICANSRKSKIKMDD